MCPSLSEFTTACSTFVPQFKLHNPRHNPTFVSTVVAIFIQARVIGTPRRDEESLPSLSNINFVKEATADLAAAMCHLDVCMFRLLTPADLLQPSQSNTVKSIALTDNKVLQLQAK